jgi:mono/diheme cytochrome c family protein
MAKQWFAVTVLAAMACAACAPKGAGISRASGSDPALGRGLFVKNCAHCHGSDARGDEGPDLHNLGWTEEEITTRIRNGKKGQMTAFADKLSAEQIGLLKDYVRMLR